MTANQIKKAIIKEILTIAPDIKEDEILPTESIQRSLEIDSFDFLKILTALYQELGVEVPEADYAKVNTLDHMVEYFSQRL